MATHRTFDGAVRALLDSVVAASPEQLWLATVTSCHLPAETLPRDVVAAYLRDHLEPIVAGTPTDGSPHIRLASVKQLDFLTALTGGNIAADLGMSARLASAWIDHYLKLRSISFHQELMLESGDRVARMHRWRSPIDAEELEYEDELTVSSIGDDGLVYFKGGNGQCAHPHRLRRLSTYEQDCR